MASLSVPSSTSSRRSAADDKRGARVLVRGPCALRTAAKSLAGCATAVNPMALTLHCIRAGAQRVRTARSHRGPRRLHVRARVRNLRAAVALCWPWRSPGGGAGRDRAELAPAPLRMGPRAGGRGAPAAARLAGGVSAVRVWNPTCQAQLQQRHWAAIPREFALVPPCASSRLRGHRLLLS